jgi:hypothetical protein
MRGPFFVSWSRVELGDGAGSCEELVRNLCGAVCSQRLDGFYTFKFLEFPMKRRIDGFPTVNFNHYTRFEQKRQF